VAAAQIDLLVLAPREFAGALEPLRAHKNDTGIAAAVLGLDEVYRNYPGRDEAEKVKQCLAAFCRENGMRFALLVGDCDRFPVRYTKSDRDDPQIHHTVFYPTDLYYADLFEPDGSVDDWDRKRDGYFGELAGGVAPGTLNIDQVDLRPEIAVGRVPASTAAEVETYVRKVIDYERGPFQPEWFKRALLIATTDWIPDACKAQERIAADFLKGMRIERLYAPGNPCRQTPPPDAANINRILNGGVGFVGYIGHGATTGWSGCYGTGDLGNLANARMLPVVFASACSTSDFAPEPPYRPYRDVHGRNHPGVDGGESFTESPPPQPACIQSLYNPESLGEHLTVKRPTGAVGYVGSATGAQPWSKDLITFFFEAYRLGHETLGGMWNFMLQRYYEAHVFPAALSKPDWWVVCGFHQPWKFFLFGDPSLRVGGIRPALPENGIAFDPGQAQAARVGGRWKIVAGSQVLLDFGANLSAALTAQRVIRHYGFNRQCAVGSPKPGMQYYLVDGAPPVGPFGEEDSIRFHPSAVTVKKVRGRWKIVEGDHWMLDFASNESDALLAFRIIQKYGFNRICFVGRPQAPMMYFRR
jgi:hypothetical protein